MSFSEGALPVTLRPLSEVDRLAVAEWPPYPHPYEELDYGLRRQTGWLDTYGRKPGCLRFAVVESGTLVGFTLLVPDGPGIAEFYVAVHPDRLSHHIGTDATRLTLQSGFNEHGLDRIFLRVRTNHTAGIHIYEKLGFVRTGRLIAETNGKPVEFFRMEIERKNWTT